MLSIDVNPSDSGATLAAKIETNTLPANLKIAVIGQGYVGLPLAAEFGRIVPTVGYDIDKTRIKQLEDGFDRTHELGAAEIGKSKHLRFSCELDDLRTCNFFIVTVPTPINESNLPDFSPLESASLAIGSILKRGDFVVYESTVFPGATEDVCVPILEKESGLRLNQDFHVGYSPERINPGDKIQTLTTIKKITSGSSEYASIVVDNVYRTIIKAGTFRAKSIKIAEAAKVIENTQRDVNIALLNELAMIFNKVGIDTRDVIEAASTKWNFLPFKPGLVGGHCIGVDPYYLSFKAQILGHYPELILTSRRINNQMANFIVEKLTRIMFKKRIAVPESRILVLGYTFKENCGDTRNTKVTDIVSGLSELEAHVDIFDPWVNPKECPGDVGAFINEIEPGTYDAIIVAVGHREFIDWGLERIRSFGKEKSVIFDVKSIFPSDSVEGFL